MKFREIDLYTSLVREKRIEIKNRDQECKEEAW